MTPVPVASKRICAIKMSLPNSGVRLLCINCYMPCDNQSKTGCSEEFLDAVDAAETLIAQHADCTVILGGDLNLDTARKNAHDLFFGQFMHRARMVDAYDLYPQRGEYTYCDLVQGSSSYIDRFAVSLCLADKCGAPVSMHDAVNPSKHSAVS